MSRTTTCPECGRPFIRRTAVAAAVALSIHRNTDHPKEHPMTGIPIAYEDDERASQFDEDVTAERHRHEEKGFDDDHDDRVGIEHLLTWGERYLAHGEDVKAGSMFRAARAYVGRNHDPRDAYEHGFHAGLAAEDGASRSLNALPTDQVYGAWFGRLAALNPGSVVLDADGDAWQKRAEGEWVCVVRCTNDVVDSSALAISTPLTVVHAAQLPEKWQWSCSACDETGDGSGLDGIDAARDHAATHTTGTFDVVPDIRFEVAKAPTHKTGPERP